MMEEAKVKMNNSIAVKSRLYYLAMVFSTLFLVRYVTLWEPYLDLAFFFRYLAWLFSTLLIFISIPQYKPQQILAVIVFLFLAIIIGINCGKIDQMYFTYSLIVGAKGLNFDNIIRTHFVLSLSFCLFNIIGNQLGFIPNAQMLDESGRLDVFADSTMVRESFGYDWCTDFASHVLLIILSCWILKRGIFSIKGIVFLLFIAFFILFETGTRMAAACIVLVALLSIYCKYRNPFNIKKVFWWGLILSTPCFALLSLFLTLEYDEADMRWLVVDLFFSGRLHLGQEAILTEGIPWFGQEYLMYGMGNAGVDDLYNYIDSSYIQYLVVCGIVATLVFILFYSRICYKAYQQRILVLPLAVLVSSFFGVITQFHFNIAYCPLLLATFATLGTGTDQSETNELMNCAND